MKMPQVLIISLKSDKTFIIWVSGLDHELNTSFF